VVRRYRCETTAADRADACALRFDPAARLGVVSLADQLLFARTNL
jgi:hypothetical protein